MFALSAVTSMEIIANRKMKQGIVGNEMDIHRIRKKLTGTVSSLPMLNMSAPANAKSPKTTGIKYFTHIRFLD